MTLKTNYKENIFCSYLITKTINRHQKKGLKERIEKHICFLFKLLKFKQFIKSPVFYYFEAIEFLRPVIGLKNSKVKKGFYIYNLANQKSYVLALEWFLKSGQFLMKKSNYIFKHYNELLSILFLESNSIAIQKSQQQYLIIIKNKFSKYYK